MVFDVTILGCSSAIPTKDRFPTAQIVNFYHRLYLIDCGEGTQMQLRKYKFSLQKIQAIFISHAHADHFLGLPGLISTMDLLGRKIPLKIYAPAVVINFVKNYFHTTYSLPSFPIVWHELAWTDQIIFDDDLLSVRTVTLSHSVECVGFVFTEKPQLLNINKQALQKYFLEVEDIIRIKNGEDYITPTGERIANADLVLPKKEERVYAYCTDTCFLENLPQKIKGVNALYHEATFDDSMKKRAKETGHSTARQAAEIADLAQVKKLYLGHYSVRYKNLEPLLEEAKAVFENTTLVYDGFRFSV